MKWPDLGPGEWCRRGDLSYLHPVDWVLHGVLAERSGTAGAVYVWHVAMPLTRPADVLDLSWSDRVGSGTQTYEIGSSAAETAFQMAADLARDLHRKAATVVDPPGGADNVLMQEARAYGLLVGGDPSSAGEVLQRVLRYTPSYDWERDMIERASRVQVLLATPNRAVDVVRAWRDGSVEALGLSRS